MTWAINKVGRETCLAIIVGLPTDQNFQRRRLNLTAMMRPAQGVAFPCCPLSK